MFDSTVIRNARLLQKPGLYQISIEGHQVKHISPETSTPVTPSSIDIAGDWLSLGAVDLQINGALGLAFPDLRLTDLGPLQTICDLLWHQGIDSFCPTIVTTSLDNFHGSLAAIQAFKEQQQNHLKQQNQLKQGQLKKDQPKRTGAQVLGAHLEGPFLNAAKRGAHPAEYLQPLTLDNVKTVIADFAEAISIVTLAPEQAVEAGVIAWLTGQGITVSLGHSLATDQQAIAAFEQGATMVTHAFNAMPGLHHREPGLLGAALIDSRVHCGFIADGQHICPTMLDLLLRAGRGRADTRANRPLLDGLFLVSDALSPLGLPDGTYPWDSRQIEVVNSTARLADGTLSGTTLPLIDGALNLVKWELCSAEEAIALVTQAPRMAMGITSLTIGSRAQFLRWQQTAHRKLTWQRLAPGIKA
ncbi:MAG: N-acetylglucosamine-6-phosphate deacetylase [Cyanobacteria bacterium J06597_16]